VLQEASRLHPTVSIISYWTKSMNINLKYKNNEEPPEFFKKELNVKGPK
jgi:hypothetical protein